MARARTRRDRTGGPPRRPAGSGGSALMVVAALLVVGGLAGGGAWLWSRSRAAAVDPVTLCPHDGPRAALAIRLDLTDPLNPVRATRLRNRIDARVNEAAVGTRLVLGVVSPDPALRDAPRIAVCKPLSGAQARALYQNPRLIEARFRDGFATPFAGALAEAMALAPADRSPIMESLQALVAGGLSGLPAGVPLRLVVVSDLLQHSDAFSLYRGGTRDRFAASPAAARLGEGLRGVEVTRLQMPRPGVAAAARPELLGFWARYFEVQGAARVSRETLGDL